ncbi:MAG: hypothetical protein ACTHQE_05320, partial [Thermomicrobiales bacterium]
MPNTTVPVSAPTLAALDRYIDRFMRMRGWRVTAATWNDTTGNFQVTLADSDDPATRRTVSRGAPSAGEATFKACSAIRTLE